VVLQGKMNVGESELMSVITPLSPVGRASAYEGVAVFVEGVMEHLGVSSSVLIEYVAYMRRRAGYESQLAEEEVAQSRRSRYP